MGHERRPTDPGTTRSLNPDRVAMYERLFAAEQRIGETRYAHGATDAEVMAAIDDAEEGLAPFAAEHDLYISALHRFVTALGGRLELHAVFEEETVVVPVQLSST